MNLYPFAEAARATGDRLRRARRGDRHRRAVDGPGRSEEPRQRRDRHRPGSLRAGARGAATTAAGSRWASARRSRSRPSATRPPTTPGSPPSCRRAWPRPGSSCPTSPACPARATRIRRRSRSRSRRSRRSATGRTRTSPRRAIERPAPTASDGPFASSAPPLQGKTLSYNNVLDASAAAALGRALRGPGVAIVKHTNPCGAAERPTLLEAWHGGARSGPGLGASAVSSR